MRKVAGLESIMGHFGCSLDEAVEWTTSMKPHDRVVMLKDALDIYKQENVELKKLAMTDPLTDLLNRRGFKRETKPVYLLEKRDEKPMSVLMIDGDRFKDINDKYGHDVGDGILNHIGKTISETIRESDILARWGGEEYVIFLPNVDLKEAGRIGCKINNAITNTRILPDDKKFTVSIGAAQLEESLDSSEVVINSAIKEADKALYWMKGKGRNGTAYFTENEFRKVSS